MERQPNAEYGVRVGNLYVRDRMTGTGGTVTLCREPQLMDLQDAKRMRDHIGEGARLVCITVADCNHG